MTAKDDQILALIEKLLDQKINDLDERMTEKVQHLTTLIEGNGKPGLVQRMETSEGRWAKLFVATSVDSSFVPKIIFF